MMFPFLVFNFDVLLFERDEISKISSVGGATGQCVSECTVTRNIRIHGRKYVKVERKNIGESNK